MFNLFKTDKKAKEKINQEVIVEDYNIIAYLDDGSTKEYYFKGLAFYDKSCKTIVKYSGKLDFLNHRMLQTSFIEKEADVFVSPVQKFIGTISSRKIVVSYEI